MTLALASTIGSPAVRPFVRGGGTRRVSLGSWTEKGSALFVDRLTKVYADGTHASLWLSLIVTALVAVAAFAAATMLLVSGWRPKP